MSFRRKAQEASVEPCTLPGRAEAAPEEGSSSRSGLLVQPEGALWGQGVSRRRLLRAGLAGAAAAAWSSAGFRPFGGGRCFAQTQLTADQALERLLEGNRRLVEGRLTSLTEDLAVLKKHTAEKQEPFAAVLACADSRVPVELIFDQTIGHVFVTRVAGNVATTEVIASLEYGAAVLGLPLILVLGHANCGAVKAAIAGKEVPGQISALYLPLRPAVDQAGSDATEAIKANARIQARLMSTASPVIAGLIKSNKLKVAAAYYDVSNGKVSMLTKET
jgi:carbonic anhydrase